jgi:hypothetical protein
MQYAIDEQANIASHLLRPQKMRRHSLFEYQPLPSLNKRTKL